ncbi:hypothetical protein L9F63_007474, partial [Diploptera punctata]
LLLPSSLLILHYFVFSLIVPLILNSTFLSDSVQHHLLASFINIFLFWIYLQLTKNVCNFLNMNFPILSFLFPILFFFNVWGAGPQHKPPTWRTRSAGPLQSTISRSQLNPGFLTRLLLLPSSFLIRAWDRPWRSYNDNMNFLPKLPFDLLRPLRKRITNVSTYGKGEGDLATLSKLARHHHKLLIYAYEHFRSVTVLFTGEYPLFPSPLHHLHVMMWISAAVDICP